MYIYTNLLNMNIEPIKGVELMKKHIPVKDPFIESKFIMYLDK